LTPRPHPQSPASQSPDPHSGYVFKNFKYSSHYCILKKLDEESAPLRILDVGCAEGYLGKILQKKGHAVTGIESNPAAAERACSHYDVFHRADIETFAFPYRGVFDYILFADVLEHLRDPAAVLRRSIPALKDSGKLIISVPNVANWIIRLGLLFGNFDPVDRGILDRTHLHFFTLRTLRNMMSEVSCRILDVTPTPVPLQLALPFTRRKVFAPLHALQYGLTRSCKTFFAYQFVVTSAPSGRVPLPHPPEKLDQKPHQTPDQTSAATVSV
jgi:2-polyprenyl-3-methyl-5-hydroxy-6-metoxy-1,4-benzoquinol methylase